MAKRGLSSKQWAKTLAVAALLVAAMLVVMLQLTDGGTTDSGNPDDAPEETVAEVEIDIKEFKPDEAEASPLDMPDEPVPDSPEEPQVEETKPAQEQPAPDEDAPPAPVPPEAQPPEGERQAKAVPTSNPVEGIRERMQDRLAALTAAVEAMEERQQKTDPPVPTAKMAEAMEASLAAEERVAEAAQDRALAESLTTPEAQALQTDLPDEEEQQTEVADLLAKEFESLKAEAAKPAPSPPAYQGTTKLGELTVEHRAQTVLPVAEAQRLLSAVREDEAMYIRSLRWNGQAKATRNLWIGMGATYALLPPRGSFAAVYRVAAPLDGNASLAAVEQEAFFERYSNRFTFLTTGEDADAIKRIETRLLRRCGQCAGYRLSLVWNWSTLAVILSDANALARAKGLRLPQDVKMIDWLAVPGSGAGRARVDVVKLVARDGREYGP